MMNRKISIISLFAIPLVSLTINAQNLVTNGSFEFANAAQAGGTETPATGGTFGWTVNNSTVLPSESVGDGNFFNQEASDGSYLLNMNVNGSYAEQTLTLVEGTTYNVSFDWNLGVNGANTSSATMSVLLGGGNVFTSDSVDETADNQWNSESFTLTGLASGNTIRFVANITSNVQTDVYFDNVVVSAVPEFSAYGLLMGLVGLGITLMRRR